MQEALNIISGWTSKWKMDLSVEKCTATSFSTSMQDKSWKPTLQINNTDIKLVDNTVFLGVTYNRRLTFGPHTHQVATKVKQRSNIIRRVASTDWGYDVKTLRNTYITLGRSIIEYASAAWSP